MGKTDVTSVKVCHDQEIALATLCNPEQRLNLLGKLGDCTITTKQIPALTLATTNTAHIRSLLTKKKAKGDTKTLHPSSKDRDRPGIRGMYCGNGTSNRARDNPGTWPRTPTVL